METNSFIDQATETWDINNRLSLYLLENLPEGGLEAKSKGSKSVAGHIAHIHSVRLMWLKASAPGLMEGLEKVSDGSSAGELASGLEASSTAMRQLLSEGIAAGRIKGFKPHPMAFLGYLLAHEAFHRSQAELVLRQAGIPLSDKVAYGLWEWGVR